MGSELNQALRLKTTLASRQNARWDGNSGEPGFAWQYSMGAARFLRKPEDTHKQRLNPRGTTCLVQVKTRNPSCSSVP